MGALGAVMTCEAMRLRIKMWMLARIDENGCTSAKVGTSITRKRRQRHGRDRHISMAEGPLGKPIVMPNPLIELPTALHPILVVWRHDQSARLVPMCRNWSENEAKFKKKYDKQSATSVRRSGKQTEPQIPVVAFKL